MLWTSLNRPITTLVMATPSWAWLGHWARLVFLLVPLAGFCFNCQKALSGLSNLSLINKKKMAPYPGDMVWWF